MRQTDRPARWIVLYVFSAGLITYAGDAAGVPPVVSKSFTPSVVTVNQVTTLTITLTNSNSFSLFGASIACCPCLRG